MRRKNRVMSSWVIENGLDMSVDETHTNTVCPFCNGGTNNDKSFSVTRNEYGFLYNCYRASCSASGVYSAKAESYEGVKDKAKTPKTYAWPTFPLSSVQRSWFISRFGLTAWEIDRAQIMYSPEKDSFVFTLLDYRGYAVGVLDRSYSGRKPKSISYWTNDVPNLHFPYGIELFKEKVVLVEDIISSIKGNRYAPTVAILGSNVDTKSIIELANLYQQASFALDPDAIKQGVRLAKAYSLFFNHGAQVLRLNKDIKDMSDIELHKLFT